MPILYSAVAHGKSVLSKYASCDGNFDEVLDTVLTKLPDRDHKMTYSHGHYLFHYIAEGGYVYFCITDKSCQRSRAFLFLNEIRRKWDSDGGDHNILFTNTMATDMYRYSEDYNTITIRRGELDELNSIGVSSSECILGEKILHVQNPDNKSYSTITYVSKSPDRIKVSVSDTRILIFGAVIFILTAAAFGPLSCCYVAVIVLGVKLMLRI